MAGLDGVRKARFAGDEVVLTVTEKAMPLPSEIRGALPERYSMGKVRVELTGTVERREGKLVLKARGSEKVLELREGDVGEDKAEHPMRRLKRLWDDGFSTFVAGGVLVEEREKVPEGEAPKVKLALEVTSASLPDEEKDRK